MVAVPAPIEILAEKLASPRPRTRIVALVHAEAHGEAARSLATTVARLFDDDDEGVQLAAFDAFSRIGRGAVEAVPVLVGLLAKGMTKPAMSRVKAALRDVGPSALAAVAPLAELLRANPTDADALEALWAIAPSDVEVTTAIVNGALSSQFKVARVATAALVEVGDAMLDRAFDEMTSRVASGDAPARLAVARLLCRLATKRPEKATALLAQLTADPNAQETWPAVHAIAELPKPWSPVLVEAMARIASSHGPAQKPAATFLSAQAGADENEANDENENENESPDEDQEREHDAAPPDLPEFPDSDAPGAPDGAAFEAANDDLLDEINELAGIGLGVLGLEHVEHSRALAEAVEAWLVRTKSAGAAPDKDDVTAVATAYGAAVSASTGWTWGLYRWGGTKHLALASHDAAYAHLPIEFVTNQISQPGTTALLLYSMLTEKKLPPAEPGSLTVIG